MVHHYGRKPEFVVLGGLVPELLCSGSPWRHAGTIDVDVQVDLEIAGGAVNGAQLETALQNAEFVPDSKRVWRWTAENTDAVVRFELLADMASEPQGSVISFDACKHLGAVNLRGTGFAALDVQVAILRAKIGGVAYSVEVNVSGLAGFLLAKCCAAHGRQKPKDWYDIAFVLLHNAAGGPLVAGALVREKFGQHLKGEVAVAVREVRSNFHDAHSQGCGAYADQMALDHSDMDLASLRADAMLAVEQFCSEVFRDR